MLPRELIICTPCGSHAKKSCVRDGLRVCRDAIMGHGCKVDLLGFETREDLFDKLKTFVGGAVFDQNKWLTFGVDSRAVQGMTGYDLNI